jgi:hypothetical protein
LAWTTYRNNDPYDTTLVQDILDNTVKDFCPELGHMASFLSKLIYHHLKVNKLLRKTWLGKF